jgi:Uma2 family endonuclease
MGEPALKHEYFVSEEEYLAGEEHTEVAHEYIAGRVYAMAVPTDTHGTLSLNIAAPLNPLLAGRKCRPFMGNMRLRISFPNLVHYIPDMLVACDDPPRDQRFREQPLAIWEVISRSTEAIDRREKLQAYTTLPTLRHYFLVRQDRVEVTHLRRSGPGWDEFILTQPELEIEVPEIGFRISLGQVYADVTLQPPLPELELL